MSANEIKMKILEDSGWTAQELNEVADELKKSADYFLNEELVYRTIARELGIPLVEEREFTPREQPPSPLLKLEDAQNDLEDGEYFSFIGVYLRPAEIKKTFQRQDGTEGSMGFFTVADETMVKDGMFWGTELPLFKNLKVGKAYKFSGMQNTISNEYGWGFQPKKYTKIELVDEEITPPVTKIVDLKDGWDTFVIKGIVDDVKEAGVDMEFCEECGKYAGTSRQMEEEETDFFCGKCQEVTNTFSARPFSGKIMDASESIDFGLPIDIKAQPFVDGDEAILAGTYFGEKRKFYAKAILGTEKKYRISLDKFLGKKKKKPAKRKKTVKKGEANIEGAISHYKLNKTNVWCQEMTVPDDILKQFSIYDIKTKEDVTALVSALLVAGEAYMPEAGILKAVD